MAAFTLNPQKASTNAGNRKVLPVLFPRLPPYIKSTLPMFIMKMSPMSPNAAPPSEYTRYVLAAFTAAFVIGCSTKGNVTSVSISYRTYIVRRFAENAIPITTPYVMVKNAKKEFFLS